MQTRIVDFKRSRDFGDLLGDTFAFLKQEYKFFGRVLLTYAGPFVLVTAIASAWMQSGILSIAGMMAVNDPAEILTQWGFKMLIYMVAAVVSSTMVICTVYSYIGLYIEKGKDGFSQEEVWQNIGQKFLPVLGSLFVMGILILLGFILCFIPGIYISVAFTLVLASLFFENASLGSALERSMFLTKNDWWFTLGVSLVIGLLVGFASYILLLPSTILSMFLAINTVQGGSSGAINIVFMILTTLGTFCASLLACMPHITFSLLYHSQVEKKESPGLLNKIDKINQTSDNEDFKSSGY
jgi:hypothetical protein